MDNRYSLAPDKLEVKKEILSEYQLEIADDYNFSISNVKKLIPNFFDKEKDILYYQDNQTSFKPRNRN